MTVEIVDAGGGLVAEGVTGEIRVHGSSVTDDCPDAGLSTGDAGFLLDGELYVVGRFGDSLKIMGRQVFAEDVEPVLAAAGIAARHVVLLGHDTSGPVALAVAETRDES